MYFEYYVYLFARNVPKNIFTFAGPILLVVTFATPVFPFRRLMDATSASSLTQLLLQQTEANVLSMTSVMSRQDSPILWESVVAFVARRKSAKAIETRWGQNYCRAWVTFLANALMEFVVHFGQWGLPTGWVAWTHYKHAFSQWEGSVGFHFQATFQSFNFSSRTIKRPRSRAAEMTVDREN